MLILSRRRSQSVRIGERISVRVLAIRRRVVELGIDAPPWVQVDREEIFQRKRSNAESGPIEVQRNRLFEALGIIEVSRHALASKLTTLDEESVIDALKAACRIVDSVAEALEKPSGLGAPAGSATEGA